MDAKLEKLEYSVDLNKIKKHLDLYGSPKAVLNAVITSDSPKFQDLPESLVLCENLEPKRYFMKPATVAFCVERMRELYNYTVEEFTDENGKTMYRHIFS
jgi:hypothetical protein